MLVNQYTRIIDVPFRADLVTFTEPGTIIDGAEGKWVAYIACPSYEELREIRGPSSNGSLKHWHSFEHYKCTSSGGGAGSACVSARPLYQLGINAIAFPKAPWVLYGNGFGAPGVCEDGLDPLYVPTAALEGFVPPPPDLTTLMQNSLRAMLPRIKSELSSINSAIELKDFKSVAGTIRNIKKLPAGLLRRGRVIKNIADILRVAADVYLQKKFNIDPLISDTHGIYRALANTEKRINALISRQGKLNVSHFTVELSAAGIVEEVGPARAVCAYRLEGGEGFNQSYASAVDTRHTDSGASRFHAQLQYNYLYDQYQLEHARVLALMDAFGVNLNPAIIWNAIPWSFVVDWLVDVGQWLNDTRVGNMDPKINIMQYLWSIKRSRRIYVTSRITSGIYYVGTGIPGNYVQSITHPVISQSAYLRVAGLPPASLLTASGLNSNEFTLGAALVISRRPRRPRRR